MGVIPLKIQTKFKMSRSLIKSTEMTEIRQTDRNRRPIFRTLGVMKCREKERSRSLDVAYFEEVLRLFFFFSLNPHGAS